MRVSACRRDPSVSRAQDVIDAAFELHREQGQVVEGIDVLLREAFRIADGKSRLTGTTAHVKALVHYIRSLVADRDIAIAALRDDKR